MWQIWGAISFLWQKPTHSHGSGLSWSANETAVVVSTAQRGSWDHRERDATAFLSCPQDLPGKQVTLGEGIR